MQFRRFKLRSPDQANAQYIQINPFAVSSYYANPNSEGSVIVELHSGTKYDCEVTLEDVEQWLLDQ
jgi:hypothetical protein